MTLLNGDQGQRTSHAHVIKRQTASTSARQNVILDKRARDKIVLVFIQVVFQHPLDFSHHSLNVLAQTQSNTCIFFLLKKCLYLNRYVMMRQESRKD